MENTVVVLQKVRLGITPMTSNSAPRCIPRMVENRDSGKYMPMNVRRSTTCHCPKAEMAQKPTSW